MIERQPWDPSPKLLARGPREVILNQRRDEAKLMVISGNETKINHYNFFELDKLLNPGDVVVVNASQAIEADLYGWDPTGRRRRIRLCTPLGDELRVWDALIWPDDNLVVGISIDVDNGKLLASVQHIRQEDGKPTLWKVVINTAEDIVATLREIGHPVQSPYVDREWPIIYYNPVYVHIAGSSEGHSAGRHFTWELIDKLKQRGIDWVEVLLHIGLSSLPITENSYEEHRMLEEPYFISEEAAELINQAKVKKGRIIAVGTSVTRALETMVDDTGSLHPGFGRTDLYIYPGYEFKIIDGLITNMHPWASTRLALARAFVGDTLLKEGYRQAIKEDYLFYEFGDCQLLWSPQKRG